MSNNHVFKDVISDYEIASEFYRGEFLGKYIEKIKVILTVLGIVIVRFLIIWGLSALKELITKEKHSKQRIRMLFYLYSSRLLKTA